MYLMYVWRKHVLVLASNEHMKESKEKKSENQKKEIFEYILQSVLENAAINTTFTVAKHG